MFIFGAFMVLSVDTINFADRWRPAVSRLARNHRVRAAFSPPVHPLHDLGGGYQTLADTFRFLCIVGLTMAFINRTVIKPTACL